MSATRISVGLLLAYCVACLISGSSYRYASVYAIASRICLMLMVSSPFVGIVLIRRELLAGRPGGRVWPVVLGIVTGGSLALLLVGELFGLPES
jgi:hypothetical protein